MRTYTVRSAIDVDRGTRYHHALLIGEAPPRDDQRPNLILQLARKAFGTAAEAGSLSAWRPPEVDRLLARTRPANLLGRWPGPNPRGTSHGSAFPAHVARKRADEAARLLAAHRVELPYRVILLGGRRVQRAFGCDQTDLLHLTFTQAELRFFCIPHPSGLNKWWNSDENRRQMREFLVKLAAEIGA
jgi:hypothetical protein